jgi:hypothetical protein
VGFGSACAPVRCTHQSFTPKGALRAPPLGPVHRSIAASCSSPKNKNNLFPEKNFPSGPNSGRQGRISFHWAQLHPTELHGTLLSYAATSWAALCSILLSCVELRCTLLSYAAFNWAMLHPFWAMMHPKSYGSPSKLNELHGTLKFKWPPLHPSQLCWSFWVLTKLMI